MRSTAAGSNGTPAARVAVPELKRLDWSLSDDGVATLTLDRPLGLNAIDRASFDDPGAAVGFAAAAPDVRALLLTGRGAHFSAGADIKEAVPPAAELLAQDVRSHPVTLLYRCPKPTVAAIRGYC